MPLGNRSYDKVSRSYTSILGDSTRIFTWPFSDCTKNMLSTTWMGILFKSSFSASDKLPLQEKTTKATAEAVAIS